MPAHPAQSEVLARAAAGDATVSAGQPPAQAPEVAAALESQIDAALADAHEKAEAVADVADTASAAALDEQLADALKDSPLASRAAAPMPGPEITALDEQIAASAPGIDDDFLSPEDALASDTVSSEAPPAGPVETPATAPAEPAPMAAATPAPPPEPAPPLPGAPLPGAPAPQPAAAPAAPRPTAPAPVAAPKPATTAPAAAAIKHSNGVGLGEMVASAIEPVAVRLGRLPRTMQQTIGWIALLTIFHAGVVWAYVLMKAPPTIEEPIGKQPTLVDEHGAPVVPVIGRTPPPKPVAPVGAGDGGHGEAKKDDHGAAAPPAKAGGGDHGGGH